MAQVIIFADCRKIRSLGPYRIASEIRKSGYSCQVISFIDYFTFDELENVCKKFITNKTLIIGFSTTFWYENFEKYTFLIDTTRKINSNTKIIAGGPNAERLAVRTNRQLDAIFLGQGEYNILQYLHHITTGSELLIIPKKIREEGVPGPIPVYESLDIATVWQFNQSETIYTTEDCVGPGEPLVLEVARGCIFKCKFCQYPLTGKKKLDHIKCSETIYEELMRNYQNHGTHHYLISDDTFNDSLEKLKILKDVFLSLPFKLTFTAYLRLDLLNAHREEIELLEEMGLVGANFGVETFHDKAAKLIGKGIVGKIAKNFLHDLKHIHWKNRIKITVGLIRGIPYETLDSYQETIDWILDENNLIETMHVDTLAIWNPLLAVVPYQSEFELNASKYGFYWPDKQNVSSWKNMIGPVKSFEEANVITEQTRKAITESGRNYQGGFNMSVVYRSSPYSNEPKTLDELIDMNRFEFSTYLEKNRRTNTQNFTNWYKQKILNL
jgi:radical SAM superfamily enzyme YgiQ (UPF0313 family)